MKPRPEPSIDQRSSPSDSSDQYQCDGACTQISDDNGNHQSADQSDEHSRSCTSNATPYTDSISHNNTTLTTATLAAACFSRRDLLLLAGASFAALSIPRWLQPASAQTATTIINKPPDVQNQQQADFLALSSLLTSNIKRNPTISARLYSALTAQVIEFEKQSSDLWKLVQSQQIKDVEALVAAVASNDGLTRVLHQIVGAWYSGMVGSGPQAKVIAYDQALMFDAVRDAVVVPTYCRAAPGYWAIQPATLKARV